jgi:DNA recombination protein RmuC
MDILFLITSLVVGVLIGWLTARLKASGAARLYEAEKAAFAQQLSEVDKQKEVIAETLRLKIEDTDRLRNELARNLENSNTISSENAALHADLKNLKERFELQKQETEELQKRLTAEFENIATKILKVRQDEFSSSNQKNIAEILNPLKEKIVAFEQKVEQAYDKEFRDKVDLQKEVKKLVELNSQLSKEANDLTKALKGDVKKQGNWGEIVLERVLEQSGLTKGVEFVREEVIEGAESNRQRPDVIVHLPESKHIIVDSKVSLVAYERFVTAETEEEQGRYLKEHCASMRSHVKLLGEKNYQNAYNINTPDFVLMFVPIEASFSVAVQADVELFSFAWERKIVIVSPSTLLATLRTVSSIWRQENQTKNAQEIARLSGTLYDKFVGFTDDMLRIKSSIDKTAGAYDDAFKKLKDGNGNLIRTAEKIKELGAKTGSKSLSQAFE